MKLNYRIIPELFWIIIINDFSFQGFHFFFSISIYSCSSYSGERNVEIKRKKKCRPAFSMKKRCINLRIVATVTVTRQV